MNPPATGASRIAPVYLIRRGEMLLRLPVREAWPLIVDYPRWQNYSRVEHVSGTPGAEGEVVLLHKEEQGFEFPPYFARTLKLEPGRRIIWKTWPQGDEVTAGFFGIVDFDVQEAGSHTRFHYDMLYEFRVAYQDESELEAFRVQQETNFDTLFAAVLPKLESLAAERARSVQR